MNKSRTIPVYNQIDVHTARMYTREAARQVGLPLIEQARVSLATSALAECLKMGVTNGSDQGRQIIVESVGASEEPAEHAEPGRVADRKGLKIAFIIPNYKNGDNLQEQTGKVRSLVDEVLIETLPDNGIRVTLLKWEDANPTEHENKPVARMTGSLSGGK